jgi:hypothetical protein
MLMFKTLSVALLLGLAACGQATSPSAADAQPAAESAGAAVTDAEKSAILAALNMRADAQGQVENECGDRVTPQFTTVDLGSGVGRAVAFMIGGGPSSAACYGDGPLIVLCRNAGGSWRQIHMRRGGMIIILPTTHNSANDLADGGPGFSFPVLQWNGTAYEPANREVADSALDGARFLP